ncbi:MAG: cytochrome c [Myxococcota bacterium]
MSRFVTSFLILAALAMPGAAVAADVAAGQAKFKELCVSCHGETGMGDGPTGKALAAAGQPAPRDFTKGEFKFDTDKDGKTGTDADLKNVISKGAMAYGGNAMMAPVVLNDTDMANVIAFIRSLKK